MSTLMKFELSGEVLQFEAGGDYPAKRRDELLQVFDRNAAGEPKVENLGIRIRTRVISFNLMSLTDYTNLLDFFIETANGRANVFSFTDEYGTTADVRFANSELDFDETSLNRYSGSIVLEYVNYS